MHLDSKAQDGERWVEGLVRRLCRVPSYCACNERFRDFAMFTMNLIENVGKLVLPNLILKKLCIDEHLAGGVLL